jgi:hypothetical protein
MVVVVERKKAPITYWLTSESSQYYHVTVIVSDCSWKGFKLRITKGYMYLNRQRITRFRTSLTHVFLSLFSWTDSERLNRKDAHSWPKIDACTHWCNAREKSIDRVCRVPASSSYLARPCLLYFCTCCFWIFVSIGEGAIEFSIKVDQWKIQQNRRFFGGWPIRSSKDMGSPSVLLVPRL